MTDSAIALKGMPASPDTRKDKPVLGMTILKDLRKNGDGYDGGTVLAPAKGKIYKAEVKVVEGGQKLEMKGKLGLFGKNSTWVRVE